MAPDHGRYFLPQKEGGEQMQEKEQEQIEVFENDIELYLKMFCEEQHIEDLKKESQSVWNSALMYIKRHVFGSSGILKSHANIVNVNNRILSNYNAYNYELVNSICDIYIYYSMLYDKEISIMGFSNLTGIDYDTIHRWGYEERLSPLSFAISKKLSRFREESLSNKLVTGNKNPVGVIAVLNRQYGWASPYTSDSNRQRVAKQDTELPQLCASNCAALPDNSIQDGDFRKPELCENANNSGSLDSTAF